MLNRREFSDFTASLESLCFADNSVLALAHLLKTGSLRPTDEALMSSAVKFFGAVLSGYTWSDKPSISQNSVQSAAAFADAVNAVSMELEKPAAFLDHIKHLRDTAELVQKNHKAPEKDVRDLQDFFTAYGYSQLERTDYVANRQDKYKTGSWLTGTR